MTELERLATVETELRSVNNTLTRMEGKLDAYAATFMPRVEADARFRNLSEEITSKTSMKSWKTVSVVVLTAVVTGLVAFFFNSLR